MQPIPLVRRAGPAFVAFLVLASCALAPPGWGGDVAAAGREPLLRAATDPVPNPSSLILGRYSFWRCHITLRPPLYGTAATAKPDPSQTPTMWRRGPTLPVSQPWSPAPPTEWTEPGLDDSAWWRQPAPFPGFWSGGFGSGPFNIYRDLCGVYQPVSVAQVSVRGKFFVADPAAVNGLTLSAAYRGGIVVYLNGKEVLRRHLPVGPLTPETLAEDYPADIFDLGAGRDPLITPEAQAKMRQRVRGFTDEPLSPGLLRKGVNVLAIEIHRSALRPSPQRWNPCGLIDVELRAQSGVAPNLTRPLGRVQVWNADMIGDVTDVDYGDPCETLDPVKIVGARGGVFSGQIVVSSDRAIKNLGVVVSSLARTEGDAAIPASGISVYFPTMDVSASNQNLRYPVQGNWKPELCGVTDMKIAGACLDTPPAEVQVRSKRSIRSDYPYVWGAVQPIWLSVAVPRNAAPGHYKGILKIRADGLAETRVPVHVTVCPWTLPLPQQFATFVDFVQSPDSLAQFYKVPRWSQEHYELIGRTFELLGQVGNKTLYIPAIKPTHFNNAETMIRWVKDGGAGYRYDFGLVEKHLDLAEKHMGRPRVVCFYVWDVYLGGEVHRGTGGMGPHAEKYKEDTVGVSVLDTATGKTETMELPAFGPEAEKYWLPFGRALVEFMTRRGLKDVMMIGIAGDIRPRKEQVEFWRKVLPEAPWVAEGHDRADQLCDAPVAYSASVFGCQYAFRDPELERLFGWQRKNVTTLFPRVLRAEGWSSGMYFRLLVEWNVSGYQNGVGRIAADFFPRPMHELKASWGNAGLRRNWLSAGARGAIPSSEFLLLREGIQECEARIFIKKALTDKASKAKLGPALAERCQRMLDERTRYAMWVFDQNYLNYNTGGALLGRPPDLTWLAGSGWQERSEQLFNAAGEVERALNR